MPCAGRVDGIVAGAEMHRALRPVGMLLVQDYRSLKAGDDLVANRVHLPTRPVLGEAIKADQPALDSISAMPPFVGVIPFHAREFGLRRRLAAGAKVDRKAE